MKELTCPNCGKAFKIDDSGYSDIVKQIRDDEFTKDLQERLAQAQSERKTAIELAEAKKDAEIVALKAELEKNSSNQELNLNLAISKVKEEFALQLTKKDEEIAFHKDYKARLSTKMVGETLEQHCEIEFEKMRSIGFPRAHFAKDNDSKSGSKGDYIFRDFTEEGIEYVSIMFEMKNESETTQTKKKNDDFLKELDKDRNEKKCEYAVLVSLLESENELYNTGIVDVSHKYPKMYVVRPQFFIPIITLLRNAAGNSAQYKTELEQFKRQNIDVTNFLTDLEDFKSSFDVNVKRYSSNFDKAIKGIDKTIKDLEETKKALENANDNLRRANSKAQDVTIKGLTRNNPTMKAKFLELENGNSNSSKSDFIEEIEED